MLIKNIKSEFTNELNQNEYDSLIENHARKKRQPSQDSRLLTGTKSRKSGSNIS